jgi:hypothetical protein
VSKKERRKRRKRIMRIIIIIIRRNGAKTISLSNVAFPGENQIPNLKINKQTLPVPNWLLYCVIFF